MASLMSTAEHVNVRPSIVGGAVALGLAVGVWAWVMFDASIQGFGYDLAPLPAAAELAAAGDMSHLYAQHEADFNRVDDSVFRDAATATGIPFEPTPFVYPPLVALAMGPALALPFGELVRLWAILSLGFVLCGLYCVAWIYAPHWRRPLLGAALLAPLCLYEPLLYSFWLGQTTGFIFCLVLGAIAIQRAGYSVLAGTILALPAFVKVTPIVFILPWLWRGPRRAAWSCLTCLAGLWLLSIASAGLDSHLAYLDRLGAIGRVSLVAFNNHSLVAFIARLAAEPGAWLDWRMRAMPTGVSLLSGAILLAGAVSAVGALRAIPTGREHVWRPLAEGFLFLGLLLGPNIAWTHYFVFLLPVISIAAANPSSNGRTPLLLALVGFVLCSRPLLPAQHIPPSLHAPLLLSGPTLAAAALFIALLVLARREAITQP